MILAYYQILANRVLSSETLNIKGLAIGKSINFSSEKNRNLLHLIPLKILTLKKMRLANGNKQVKNALNQLT